MSSSTTGLVGYSSKQEFHSRNCVRTPGILRHCNRPSRGPGPYRQEHRSDPVGVRILRESPQTGRVQRHRKRRRGMGGEGAGGGRGRRKKRTDRRGRRGRGGGEIEGGGRRRWTGETRWTSHQTPTSYKYHGNVRREYPSPVPLPPHTTTTRHPPSPTRR